MRGARLFRIELAPQIADRIVFQRDSWIATLLRAVVHQSILANIEVASASATAPLIGPAERDVVLKCIDARKAALLKRFHLVVDAPLIVGQRLHLAGAVMNNANRRT